MARGDGAGQVQQVRRLVTADIHGGHIAVTAVFLMFDPRVLHGLLPLLHGAAGVAEAGTALRQVLVFQLQAGRQQVNQQGIRYALLGLDDQVHQHQLATVEVVQRQRLAIHAEVFAEDAEVLATGRRQLTRIARQAELLVERLAAEALHRQRRLQAGAFQLQGRLLAVECLYQTASLQLGLPVTFRLVEQTPAGEEHGIAFLGRQVLVAGQVIGQAEQPAVALRLGQVMLLQQGVDQRVIAQTAAVIAVPVVAVGFELMTERGLQQGIGARLIAHQLQGHRQVRQRQAAACLALPFGQRAQAAQRSLLTARQHIAGVGLHGEAHVLAVFAVVHVDQLAILQVAQQALAGLLQRLVRHAVALLAGTQQEVGDIGRQPVFLVAVTAPQAEAAVVALHAEQALDTQLQLAAPLLIAFALDAQTLEAGGIGIQRRIQTAGGLLQTTVGISLEFADLLGEVQRRLARQAQQPLQAIGVVLAEGALRQGPAVALEHRAELLELRRVGRAHADLPLPAERRQLLAGQVQTIDPDAELAGAQAADRTHGNRQRDALALRQLQRHAAGRLAQLQLTAGRQLHIQLLRRTGEVGQVQRQRGFVTAGEEARCRQLGHQRRGNHRLGLALAVAVVAPGLRHQAQLAVEVGDIQTDLTFALGIKGNRRTLLGHDQHAGIRPFAAAGQRRVTTEGQTGQTALAGFDQLAIDVQLVGAVALAAEEGGKGIGRCVLGDIEDADVHRRHQHLYLLGQFAPGTAGLHLDLEGLVRTHLLRRRQLHGQLPGRPLQRQVQQADRTLGRDVGLALTGTDHQRADIQIVTGPGLVHRNLEGLALGRHFDVLPPQRAIAGLDQQVAIAGRRRRHRHPGGTAGSVRRLVQRQLDLIRTHGAALGVVLPAVAGPEALTADQTGLRVFHLDAVRAPLHREADLGGLALAQVEAFLAEVEVLLVEVIAPALGLGEAPEVVAALAHQAHLEPLDRQLVALGIGQQHLEFGHAVVTDFLTLEQRAHTRQAGCRPYRLDDAPGDRTAAGLLQAGLQNQLERRARLGPAVLRAEHALTIGIQGDLVELHILIQLFLGHRAELIARQARHRLAQRAHIELAGQAVAGSRRAVEVTTVDAEAGVFAGIQRLFAALEFQREALGKEVLDEELIEVLTTVAQIQQQLPAAGRRILGQLQLVLVQPVSARLPDETPGHLLIRTAHLDAHRLRLDRTAIGVAQQGIEQHRFTGAIEIARAEDEELQRIGDRPGDIEFGQIQRRRIEAQQAGVVVLARQQHIGLVHQRQFGMAGIIGGGRGQNAPVAVQQVELHITLRGTTGQRLGEHIELLAIAVG